MAEEEIGCGKNGYYLAASGSVAWDDLYSAMAKAMVNKGVIADEIVDLANDTVLEKMGEALGSPKEFVRVQLGGK